ncbi:hypothetical protein [Thermogemmatispora sp.]|uniref:hypothetical protein n=1 Tax=Thermogemmatispora sp. TaxID=1968838 RepID=UPI00263145E7|nr:hypothetical protein [Thermogemmatispora sp.]
MDAPRGAGPGELSLLTSGLLGRMPALADGHQAVEPLDGFADQALAMRGHAAPGAPAVLAGGCQASSCFLSPHDLPSHEFNRVRPSAGRRPWAVLFPLDSERGRDESPVLFSRSV